MRIFSILLFFFWGIDLLIVRQVSAHTENVTVMVSEEGLSPAEITVDQGSLVTFVNSGKDEHWPASDFHPTHDLYPEFDPRKAIPPGEVWGFRAGKTGKWGFHDHLDPHKKGTLIVQKETGRDTVTQSYSNPVTKSPSEASILERVGHWIAAVVDGVKKRLGWTPKVVSAEEFKKLSSEKQFEELTKLSKQKDAGEGWKFLTEVYADEAGNAGSIHDLAHLAGGLVFQGDGWDGLAKCTVKFAFGCYHGFFDVAFSKGLNELPRAYEECLSVGSANSGPFGSCIHGVGHGVASFYQTRDLQPALSSCDQLSNGSGFCHDGVFMEFERGAGADFYKANNPYYPCDSVGEEYAFSCGRNLPNVLLGRFGKNFATVAEICLGGSEQVRAGCMDALGFIAAGRGQGDSAKIISFCDEIKDVGFRTNCLIKAAGELIFAEVPGWQGLYLEVCQATLEKRGECEEYAKHIISDYHRDVSKVSVRSMRVGESAEGYVASLMQLCSSLGSFNKCYEQVGKRFFDQFGLRGSMDLLKGQENVPAVYARCHEVTHYLSRNEYVRTRSIPEVYHSCDSTCHGGCYHGALEAFLKEKQVDGASDVKDEIASVCGKRNSFGAPIVYFECVHGLGHAAMFVTDMEVRQSLSMCDVLSSRDDQERCYSGVFMENSSSSTSLDHPSNYIKKDDPMFPCNALEEKYLPLCYRYQSSYFAIIAKYDWQKVIDLCFAVPGRFQHECFRTMGTNQVGFSPNVGQWVADCELVPNGNFKNICHAGVVSSLSYRFVGEVGRLSDYCLRLPFESSQTCFEQIGYSVVEWSRGKSEAGKYCQEVSSREGRQWCLEGVAEYPAVS